MDLAERAYLYLLSPEEGGCRKPIFSGFRCNCWIGALTENGERSYNDAAFFFDQPERLMPGSATPVRILPFWDEKWADVTEESTVAVCEGARQIGTALVTEVLERPVA